MTRPAQAAVRQAHHERARGVRQWTARVEGWYPKTSLYSLNARQHWGARKRLQDDAAERAGNALKYAYWPCISTLCGERWVVTLTVFQCKGRRPDGDNLQGSLKHVRDSVAKYLGIDDGDAGIEWRYEWKRGADGVLMSLEEVA